jgi:hypothetical protein
MAIERIKRLEGCDFTSPGIQGEVFSLLEALCGIIIAQEEEIQELKDEINRLKGEKGKPKFKAPKPEDKYGDKDGAGIKPRKAWKKSSKAEKVQIDRVETIRLDKAELPDDAISKGYEEKVIQNIIVQTDNVLYLLEKYYSPSTGKTYIAKLDESLQGTSYGPETKALISTLYYENRVTENKIASFLNANGLHISEGYLLNAPWEAILL